MRFVKYQALGNDYLVVEPAEIAEPLDTLARRLCDRHYGAGADGLLVGLLEGDAPPFRVRIFNPDGSEAEKSGNGLRIFARYLFDRGRVGREAFAIQTVGGVARAQVLPEQGLVQVGMGRAVFESRLIPVAGEDRLVLGEALQVGAQTVRIHAVSLGNPHCVVFLDQPTPQLARELGPRIETHPVFPHRTNVQLAQVLDREHLRIEIWERGAGYTLASGSSACAASAVAHRLGWCGAQVEVRMPGGALAVFIAPDDEITLAGPAERVYEGVW
jgi:diaminopimelate epimerase